MRKSKKWLCVIISVVSAFVLINLVWGIFVLRCIFIRNQIPYNRTRSSHVIHDASEGYIYGGFDEFHYLSFQATGYINAFNRDKIGWDSFLITYDILHGFRFRYVYVAETYNHFEGLRKGEAYEFWFDKNHNIIKNNSSVAYEVFREAAEAMFERANRTWGIE